MDMQAPNGNPKIHVGGLDFEWDLENGRFLCAGNATVCMWIETTMAGFMQGLQKMVGTERFNLALYSAGEDGIEAEWQHLILPHPSVEEGLATIGGLAKHIGLGYWELRSLDRDKKEARFTAKYNWESGYQKALGVSWGSSSLAGRFAGYCSKIFGTHCWAEQVKYITRGDEFDEFLVRPSARTVGSELERLVAQDKASRADLDAALERLKHEVQERRVAEERLKEEIHERKLAEESLLEKLEIIRRQEESIRAMSTPILQLWQGVLALPVIGLVDSARAASLMENVLEAIVRTKAKYTIVDLTGVDVMDTSAANHLLRVVRAAALLGTTCLVSGVSPHMAQTIVQLDLDLAELVSFSTLEAALRYALEEQASKPGAPGRPAR